jgi:secreted Zn-dependent insulinase-like peptidase
MALAVLGREPVNEQADRIRALFADVPAGAGETPQRKVALFETGRLPLEVNIVPEREYRSVALSFPVSSLKEHYRVKPLQYVAHLVGHEGPGSLVSLLRRRGLANSLSAGTGLSHIDVATFQVRIGLTQHGLTELDTVVELVFAALQRIRDAGPEPFRYAEFQRMSELSFQYMDTVDAGSLTQAIAHSLHDYAPMDVLVAPYLVERFDAGLTWHYLNALTPENLLLTVTAPGLPTDNRTPHFNAPYSIRPVAPTRVARWRSPVIPAALQLPGPNKYLPDDLALQADASAQPPKRLSMEPGFALWHQQDTSFGAPRSSFFVNLRTRAANATALGNVQTQLLVTMLNEQLTEIAYPAALAGLGVQLYKHLRGLSFRISGYSSRQDELAKAVVAALYKPELSAGRFERVKAAHRRALNNQAKAQPYRQGLAYLTDLLLEPKWTREQRLTALEEVDLETLSQFAGQWLLSIDSVALAHGNVTSDGAVSLARTLDEGLLSKVRTEEVPRARVVKLRSGDYLGHVLSVPHNDSALVLYFQGQGKQYEARAAHALVAQILSGPFYTELRTRKQLGYVVFASSIPVMNIPGLAFVAQSPNTDTFALRQHADTFLASATATLTGLRQADFERFRESLVERLLEPDKTLSQRSNRYWQAIDRHPGQFDEREKLAAAVRATTRKDVIATFHRTVVAPQRARVEVHVVPASQSELTRAALAKVELIDSVSALRAARARFLLE